MSTYDHKQVLNDYEKGKITPEMAIGHGLQHIAKLYEAQAAVNTGRGAEQARVHALETRLNTLQATVDRLNAIIDKARRKQKAGAPKPSQPDQI